jgi:hypothetical protein
VARDSSDLAREGCGSAKAGGTRDIEGRSGRDWLDGSRDCLEVRCALNLGHFTALYDRQWRTQNLPAIPLGFFTWSRATHAQCRRAACSLGTQSNEVVNHTRSSSPYHRSAGAYYLSRDVLDDGLSQDRLPCHPGELVQRSLPGVSCHLMSQVCSDGFVDGSETDRYVPQRTSYSVS